MTNLKDLYRAKELFAKGGYACVAVRESTEYYGVKGGIAPLIDFIDENNMQGFSVADKIAGKAAALLYAKMGLSAVYAEVLSVPAEEILKKHGIYYEYKTLTQNIINRRGDGICPMEQAVEKISDPDEAYKVLSAKIKKHIYNFNT